MINDLELMANLELLHTKPVVLYGASSCGRKIYAYLDDIGIEPRCFCDSNPERWGEIFIGKKILSLDELREYAEAEEVIIIISSEYCFEINQTLEEYQIPCKYVFTGATLQYALYRRAAQTIPKQQTSEESEYVKGTAVYSVLWATYEMERIYPINAMRNFLQMRKEQKNPILIYQAGKVGSSSVCASLEKYDMACHIHEISPFTDVPALQFYAPDETVKIISLVREPIGRDLSYYFQCLNNEMYLLRNHYENYLEEVVEFMKAIAGMKKESEPMVGTGPQFDWFDNELKAMFGIDVYEHPFDSGEGYQIIKQGNVELLLMKMERLNDLEHIIGEFAGVEDFSLISDNVGSQKGTWFLYQQTKEVLELPQDYVDFYYKDNERLNHFYGEEERTEMKQRWKIKKEN